MSRQGRLWRWVVLLGLLLALRGDERARAAEPLPDKVSRVVGLARLWAQVKFFHPYLAYKDIDWDGALVRAIPEAEAATSAAEYQAAVKKMLAVLDDPLTRVVEPAAIDPATTGMAADGGEVVTWPSEGVLEVRLSALMKGGWDYTAMVEKAGTIGVEAAKAKVVVLDARVPGIAAWADAVLPYFIGALPAIDAWPTQRVLQHVGYRPQAGATSGDYTSTFITVGEKPAKAAPEHGATHVIAIVRHDLGMPAVVRALQASGHATVVSDEPLSGDDDVEETQVLLPWGAVAQVRLGESTWPAAKADVVVGKGKDAEARALELAKKLVKSPPAKGANARPVAFKALPPMRLRNDEDYPASAYPSRELRMLAAIKLWAVFEYFEPYRFLVDDWEAALREALPAVEAAKDAEAYLHALQVQGARMHDGHVWVYDPAAFKKKPRGGACVEVRWIEKQLVVTRVVDAVEAKKEGLAVGDVIEKIDGKSSAEAAATLRPRVSGSTSEARDQLVAEMLLWGDDGSAVSVEVRGADKKLRQVSMLRSAAIWKESGAPSTAPHWKKLPGNIGYVDLTQLTVPEVPAMFADLGKTKAIVFDMRGYPNGTAWSIAPRVNVKKAKYGAMFLAPLVMGGESPDQQGAHMRVHFLQSISRNSPEDELYRGKVVVLIDDRAISQAEHTCLFLEQTAGATFVGSPTHGANGDITAMRLPGGLRATFTGQEVRHVDGRQLQRVGIQPDVLVRPTLAGVRAGKDEVLERALEWIAKGK